MQHKNYYAFTAKTNYDLGLQMGGTFKNVANNSLKKRRTTDWKSRRSLSQGFLQITVKYFPEYIQELKGYAKGADIDFIDLWIMSLEDELNPFLDTTEKCTFGVTNRGKLLFHNEDWEADAKDSVCVVQKTVDNLTILELYYYNTLGGCSVSVNSHGFVHSINSLSHKDKQVGVPRNVIARWFSETDNPQKDFEKMKTIRRSSGYNHNIVSKNGNIYNIESSATKQILTLPSAPFTHTNHYLTKLEVEENSDNSSWTKNRFKSSCSLLKEVMTLDEVKQITLNQDQGEEASIFNERTIGKMVVDFDTKQAYIWLMRESEVWITYDLFF